MIHQQLLGQLGIPAWLSTVGILFAVVSLLVVVLLAIKYGRLWLQARLSDANVSLGRLVGMSFRKVDPVAVVKAQVMATQAGLTSANGKGASNSDLEAHYLAGGDINRVVLAIIAANRANIDLDFDRAAAIDLSGRDLSEAVRTSVFPKVIDCPDNNAVDAPQSLSAITKNGIELLIRVRVTVRTNLDQLIGGATEETIIARVGQGIVSTIGSMETHEEALGEPSRISRSVLEQGIQSNTAYEIVSIDVSAINIGRNIGARLQSEQAEADTRVARASAEVRRANAVATLAEMVALVSAKEAELVLAEACIASALADAFRNGQFDSGSPKPLSRDSILKFPDSDSQKNA